MTVPPCVVADGSLSTGAPNRRKVTTAEAEVNAEAEAEAGMGKPVKKVSGREGQFRSADQTDHHDADVGDAATTTDSADDRREGEDAERPRKTVLNSISTLPFRSVLPRMRHRRHLPAAWASAYVPRRK